MVLLLGPCLAFGQGGSINVVFDLDWTLLNKTTPAMVQADPTNTFEFNGEWYRIAHLSVESIVALHKAGIQISIFSGGEMERNQFAAILLEEKIKKHLGDQSFSFHKILNKNDLLVVNQDPQARFTDRYKKELSRFFNLENTLLVDDIAKFVVPGQEKNMAWLGPTYNDRPRAELQHLEEIKDKAFTAPHILEWLRDRHKIQIVTQQILRAVSIMQAQQITLVEAYAQINPYHAVFCAHLF
jgi:hypothetical protein